MKSIVKRKHLVKLRVEDCFNVQRRWSKKKKEIAELIVGCRFRREIEAETEVMEIQGKKV